MLDFQNQAKAALLFLYREVGEKGLDLDRPHLARVALAKMSDKSFNPVQICLLGTQAVVQEAYPAPHLLKQPRRRTRIHR